jgi:hypothetical protein
MLFSYAVQVTTLITIRFSTDVQITAKFAELKEFTQARSGGGLTQWTHLVYSAVGLSSSLPPLCVYTQLVINCCRTSFCGSQSAQDSAS